MELAGSKVESFEKDGHRVLWADALVALRECIEDSSVDLVFADPPYNIGKRFANSVDKWPSIGDYIEWCKTWLRECVRVLRPNGSMYIMTSTQAMPYLDIFLRDEVEILSRIVWRYDSSGVQARGYFGSLYEPILHCVMDKRDYTFNADAIEVTARTGATRKLIDYRGDTPKPYAQTKVPGNVWYFPRVRYRMPEYEEHPTQKPESLLERIILASSKPEDVILDPFSGTFTTCAVAKRMKRQSIGIEMDREYVRIGLRRLGIQSEWNGELLLPPKKNYTPGGAKPREKAEQKELFTKQ
jgi:site-specific DNA-methyltransferase (adenine-specific)